MHGMLNPADGEVKTPDLMIDAALHIISASNETTSSTAEREAGGPVAAAAGASRLIAAPCARIRTERVIEYLDRTVAAPIVS